MTTEQLTQCARNVLDAWSAAGWNVGFDAAMRAMREALSTREALAAHEAQGDEPFAHICVLPTKDAGPTKFFTAPSDPRGFPVYTRPALAAVPVELTPRRVEEMLAAFGRAVRDDDEDAAIKAGDEIRAAIRAPQPQQAGTYSQCDVLKAHTEGYKLGLIQVDRPQPQQACTDTALLDWLEGHWGEIHQHWTATAIGLPARIEGYSYAGSGPVYRSARDAIRAALAIATPPQPTAPDPLAQAVSQTVAWAIPGTGQFSFERQDERFWTPLVAAPSAAQKEPT